MLCWFGLPSIGRLTRWRLCSGILIFARSTGFAWGHAKHCTSEMGWKGLGLPQHTGSHFSMERVAALEAGPLFTSCWFGLPSIERLARGRLCSAILVFARSTGFAWGHAKHCTSETGWKGLGLPQRTGSHFSMERVAALEAGPFFTSCWFGLPSIERLAPLVGDSVQQSWSLPEALASHGGMQSIVHPRRDGRDWGFHNVLEATSAWNVLLLLKRDSVSNPLCCVWHWICLGETQRIAQLRWVAEKGSETGTSTVYVVFVWMGWNPLERFAKRKQLNELLFPRTLVSNLYSVCKHCTRRWGWRISTAHVVLDTQASGLSVGSFSVHTWSVYAALCFVVYGLVS